MTLEGARIYCEGVGMSPEFEVGIRQIVGTIRAFSLSLDVSMRFLKNGKAYEALLWGKANEIPIGIYNRGPSMGHVLDNLHKKVKKACLKSRQQGMSQPHLVDRRRAADPQPFSMAG